MEKALVLHSNGRDLVAIIHVPEVVESTTGVVIVVGGPQYRIGSHRQFVLLARDLAMGGVPVIRFDCAGMGDSEGPQANFERIDEDIRAATDQLLSEVPVVKEVALWGLCDGASAALMYAPTDSRVSRLILANPWVRTESGLADSYLKGYYHRRFFSREFWIKMIQSPRAMIASGREFIGNAAKSGAWSKGRRESTVPKEPEFLVRMLRSAERFRGSSLVLLSGTDLVATEFKLRIKGVVTWRKVFASPAVSFAELPGASHTFSSSEQKRWVSQQTLLFVLNSSTAPRSSALPTHVARRGKHS